MKGKSIRGAIITSALAAVLCVGLLAGITFAWFTDSLSNTGNRIVAGRFGVEATVAALAAEGEAAEEYELNGVTYGFGEATGFEGEAIINDSAFAPGSVNAKLLTVRNAEDIAAVIKIEFVITEDALKDALWFDFVQVKNGAVTGEFTRRPMSTLDIFAKDREFPLGVGESIRFILIYGMNEDAGPEYQGLSFGVDAYILARQDSAGAKYEETPASAQSALDAVTNDAEGATVRLGAGNYGELGLSQTANSRYEKNEGASTSNLYRTIKDLTIVGAADGSTVVDGIEINSGHICGSAGAPVTNPVTGETTESSVNSFYSYIEADGITFRNITFTKHVYFNAYYGNKFARFRNITFENCTFEGRGPDVETAENRLATFGAGSSGIFENIVFRNCTVRNAYQGVYMQAPKNVTVENCAFYNIGHNAIAVQSGDNSPVEGTVVIRGNRVEKDADRAVRFGDIADGTQISVNGNIFIDAGDWLLKTIIKAGTLGEGVAIDLNGNYWNGLTPEKAIDSGLRNAGFTDNSPITEIN